MIKDPGNVLIIHYSQSRTYDEEYDEISPLISAIVIKSLDGKSEYHFAIHLEADKANIPVEEIENSYRDLEFRTLKAFNEFVKRHGHCIWVHWNMKNVHFGFEAIRHRFEKIFAGLRDRIEEIPSNSKVNLALLIEEMYGDKYANESDTLASMMKLNNSKILSNDYLTLENESVEFEKKNFKSVLASLDCKTDFLCKSVRLLSQKKLKVWSKNSYASFVEFIAHPLINFIFFIIGLVLSIMSLK